MDQPHHGSTQVWHALSGDHTVLSAIHAFIHEWNEAYLSLPFQPKLVLIYWPQRDGRLSWPRHHISQLLAAQAVTPHWATWTQGSIKLMMSRAANHDTDCWAIESLVLLTAYCTFFFAFHSLTELVCWCSHALLKNFGKCEKSCI